MIAGDSIGPYLILEPLGAGGMGEVYRARDTRLAREVALKRLSDPELANDTARRHVLREARAAAALSHPGIATIFDVLETPEGLIIVMEYAPGQSLAARIRNGKLPVDEALDVAIQLTDALTHAHDHGVIHRDLKPANVHLTPDRRAKILDFGIAKAPADPADDQSAKDEFSTAVGRVIGSPGYMAPEQLAGGRSDARTDVYGVGLLLFEMLTGERAFPPSDIVGSALAVFNGPVPRVRDRAPHVPADINELTARAMARAPQDRFPTTAALGAALRAAMRNMSDAETAIAGPPSADVVRVAAGWQRRYRAAVAAASAAILALAGFVVIWMQFQSSPVSAHSSVVGILPFRNQSGNPADDALAAGLTDALMKRLGSVRSLRVLPLGETREALAATKDPTTVAHSLGAGFMIEGLLQRTGETVDVNMFLVGDDGKRRPAGRYSGDVDRLFELHRRVAEGMSAALNQEGVVRGGEPETAPPTANQDAFADYAQARVFLDRADVPGSLDHAIELLQRATKRDPRFALAYAALGEAYWAQFRETQNADWTVKAQAANLEALRLDPAQPEVRMALAVMYEGLGRTEQAMEELRQVLALQPQSDNAHLVLSRILTDKGAWDAAVAEARTAITLRPTYWRNHAQLGDTLMRAGRFDESIAAYTRLTELQPDSPRGFQRLGTVLQTAGRNDEALANYAKATAIRPSPATYSNMGTLYYWRGDYARAADAYEHAIALAPNTPQFHGNLGDAMMRLGQRARALDEYRQAATVVAKLLAVKPNDPLNLASLALYQAKFGDRSAAAATITRAIALSPGDGQVLYVRAAVHALAGENAAACNDTREALAHGKSAEEVRRADELRTLKGCAAYDGIAVSK